MQSNTNTASATLTAPSSDVAIQVQLAEQINLNVQGGASIAAATSDFVEVRAPRIRRWATALQPRLRRLLVPTSQSATQSNSNTAATTLPPVGVADNDTVVLLPTQLAVQLDGILQANANLQGGAAIAVASSDYVSVEQGGPLSAGLDGLTATSSAAAGANLNQSASQNNTNSNAINRADGPPPGEDQFSVPPRSDCASA